MLGGEWLVSLDSTGTVGKHKYIPLSSGPPRSLPRTAHLLPPLPHFGKGQHKRAGLLKAVELFKHASNDPRHLHGVFVTPGQHLLRDHIAPAPAQRRAVAAKARLSRAWCDELCSLKGSAVVAAGPGHQ